MKYIIYHNADSNTKKAIQSTPLNKRRFLHQKNKETPLIKSEKY